MVGGFVGGCSVRESGGRARLKKGGKRQNIEWGSTSCVDQGDAMFIVVFVFSAGEMTCICNMCKGGRSEESEKKKKKQNDGRVQKKPLLYMGCFDGTVCI